MSEEGTTALNTAKYAMWLAEQVQAQEEKYQQVLMTDSPAGGVLSLLSTALMALDVFARKGNEAAAHDVAVAMDYAGHLFASIGAVMIESSDEPMVKALEYMDKAKELGLEMRYTFGEEEEEVKELIVPDGVIEAPVADYPEVPPESQEAIEAEIARLESDDDTAA